MTEEIRTLLIVTPSEEIKIDIPKSWKVTFGPFNPGQSMRNQPTEGASLRIYEAKDKQRACFTNVIMFRDLGLNLRRRTRTIDVEGKKVKVTHLGEEFENFEVDDIDDDTEDEEY